MPTGVPRFVLLLPLALALGCNSFSSLWKTPDAKLIDAAAPGKHSTRVSQFVFYSDVPLTNHTALFNELGDHREQLFRDLKLPDSQSIIQVFLFEDEERYAKYMKSRYPELPRRRAFFIAQPKVSGGVEDLYVFTFQGEHLRQDLRHESTHAMLHASLRDVPLWLDEGLAEYYELPPEKQGLNTGHVETIRSGPFLPDMARLEGLTQVRDMDRAEYREAWAWVHFLLRSSPESKAVLLAYLKQLRTPHTQPPSLYSKLRELHPAVNDELNRHLAKLESTMRATVNP